MTDLKIIGRSLAARRFSTVITVLLVATAVGLLAMLLSMREAGRRAFEQGVGNLHMLVSGDASPLVAVLNGIFYANPPRSPIPWSKYEQIAGGFPLEYAIPIQQGDSYLGFPVLCSTRALFEQYQPDQGEPWRFAEGGPFQTPFEVVVGARAAREGRIAIGDELHLTHGSGDSRAQPAPAAPEHEDGDDEADAHDHHHDHVHDDFSYRVVGILEPTGGPHDRALFTDLESSWVIHAHDRRRRGDPHAHTTVDDLTDADRMITGIYLRVATRAGAMMSGAQQQVFDSLRRDPTITVADPVQEISNLFRIVSNVDELLLAMAVVVMISSGIAIMLALYNSMEQRRRQIAVLRVLGCSRGRIFSLIVTESTIIGLVGAAFGILLAMLGGIAVAAAMKGRFGLVIQPRLDIETILPVTVATIVIAAAAGLVPAITGYRTAVVRSLRPIG